MLLLLDRDVPIVHGRAFPEAYPQLPLALARDKATAVLLEHRAH